MTPTELNITDGEIEKAIGTTGPVDATDDVATKGIFGDIGRALPVIGAVNDVRDGVRMLNEGIDSADEFPSDRAYGEYLFIAGGRIACGALGTGIVGQVEVLQAYDQWVIDHGISDELQEKLEPNMPLTNLRNWAEENEEAIQNAPSSTMDAGRALVNATFNSLDATGGRDPIGALRSGIDAARDAWNEGQSKSMDEKNMDEKVSSSISSISAEEAVGFLANVDEQIGDTVLLADGSNLEKADVLDRFEELLSEGSDIPVELDKDMSTDEMVSAIITAGMATRDQVTEFEVAKEDYDYAL